MNICVEFTRKNWILDFITFYEYIHRLFSESFFEGLLEENIQAEETVSMTQKENDLFSSESRSLRSLRISKNLSNSGMNLKFINLILLRFHLLCFVI